MREMKAWFERTFIPQEGNEFQPHVLQKAAVVGMTVLVLISFSVANLQSILWFSSEWLVSTILPAVVTDATNSARASEGQTPLVRSEVLDEAARLKAEDMAAKGYFAHWSPDGVSPWHWFGEAGYQYIHAGENLAVHFTDSTAVVDAWLDSPTHRDNILNGSYSEIGIGTAEGEYEGHNTVFVVQMFGSPAAAPVSAISAPVSVVDDPVIEEEEQLVADVPVSEPVVAGAGTDESITVTDAGTVVFESFAATAAPAPAVISSAEGKNINPPSTFTRLLTSPRMLLQLAYTVIGLMVLFMLSVSIIVEWRRHHPVQLAYATALLFFMIVLFEVHMIVSSGVTIA
jgi:hypothetical protein